MKNKKLSDIEVYATFEHGFETKVTKVYLKKGDVEMELDEADWLEIKYTLAGKRKRIEGKIDEGDYTPKNSVVFNT